MHSNQKIVNTFTSKMASLRRCRDGIASIEFVMILPVLAIMLFGLIDMGRLLADYQLASKSVRDATRYLSRMDAAAMALTCTAIDDTTQPITEAKNLALTGKVDGVPATEPLLVYWTDPTSISVTPSCRDNSAATYSGFYEGVEDIPVITLSGTVTFPILNGWIFDRANLTFTVSHQEVHIGQ